MEKSKKSLFNLSTAKLLTYSTVLLIIIQTVFLLICKMLQIDVKPVYYNILPSSTTIETAKLFSMVFIIFPLLTIGLFYKLLLRVIMGWMEIIFKTDSVIIFIVPVILTSIIYALAFTPFGKSGGDICTVVFMIQFFLMGIVLSGTYLIFYYTYRKAFWWLMCIYTIVNAFSILLYYLGLSVA